MARAAAAIVPLLILLLALAAIWAFQRRLIYFPLGDLPEASALGLRDVEAVTLRTSDGLEAGAWFLRSVQPARFTCLVFSGNAGHRAYRVPLAEALRARSLHVLLTDYRGYGGNPGVPTESGLAADARAAREYARGRSDVDPTRLVYFGESLGSAVAVALAAEHPPAALILRSPFTSMADIAQHHYPFLPVRLLLRDRFASIDRIGSVRAPLLVVAGDADRIVPTAYSRALFDAANEPKTLTVVRGADHNDQALLAGTEMIEAIDRFLHAVDQSHEAEGRARVRAF
jgi:uncharacterized protein